MNYETTFDVVNYEMVETQHLASDKNGREARRSPPPTPSRGGQREAQQPIGSANS